MDRHNLPNLPTPPSRTLPSPLILLGAGSKALESLTYLHSHGIEIACLADNDKDKHGKHVTVDGEMYQILSPSDAILRFPQATWTVSVISRPAATELRVQIRDLGVKTVPFHRCLPAHHALPASPYLYEDLLSQVADRRSITLLNDQWEFRASPDEDRQESPDDVSTLYFPPFIRSLGTSEVFVDCGAADGDTLHSFLQHNPSPLWITAFEPDPQNFAKLQAKYGDLPNSIRLLNAAVGDHSGRLPFSAQGNNYSSFPTPASAATSLPSPATGEVEVLALDDPTLFTSYPPHFSPTYIKFDIEGAELDALWGARKLLAERKPVLAICAYHASDHLWKIPLLVHALEPSYQLLLRRYAEGTWELVWYCVPEERLDRSGL